MRKAIQRTLLCGTATVLTVCAVPAFAQDEAPQNEGGAGDIVVTARRVEERLQDVPISITVFNQQQLNNKNIVNANDLATYTPSLSANTNFGSDNTTFAIRGFAQDIGTAPSVGTYFGDVVTPRGASNGQPVGDGASAGDFFDLQNVQVLKGPQGTLFGRNTTGGAVLFVPQKPTGQLEGYIEGSIGNYDMRRVQGVVNIPLSDTFRVRAGFDHMERDGFLNNVSGIGPSRFGDTDYWAGRLSIVGDLTPNLENYIIASYSRSQNNGALGKLVAADPAQNPFGGLATAQLAQQGNNFYNVENALPTAGIKTTQWQVIDTVTWKASDSLTVKNIASYAELKQRGVNPIFGIRWQVPVNGVLYNTNFQEGASPPDRNTAYESTFTDELRLEGSGDKFSWQAGAYLEVVRPRSDVGSQSPGFASCLNGSNSPANCTDTIRPYLANQILPLVLQNLIANGVPPATAAVLAPGFALAAIPPIGNVNYTVGRTSFHDVGLYAQGTYKLTDEFKVTAGFRYTWDRQNVDATQTVTQLAPAPTYGAISTNCSNPLADANCLTHFAIRSSAPTWLLDFDYTPNTDLLVYAKYARGYRAATIAPNIPEGGTFAAPDTSLNYVKQEKVDAFEVGLKSSFGGSLRGTFNVAAFYNKFSNQQLQVGFLPINPGLYPQTAAPVNAGKSKIYGVEVEASLSPFRGLDLNLSYTYLRTRIDQVNTPPNNVAYNTQAAFLVGDEEVLSPRNKLTASATYTLPTPESIGRISIGGSVTYRSSMLVNYIDRSNVTVPSIAAFGRLPGLTLVNANVGWQNAAGLPVDVNFFVTNLTNKKYYTFAAGLGSPQLGFETANVGEPRMYGVRLRYSFGR
ncbi:MAG: TonB-dependent receptor [Novosphingobium sp.]|nr:TonB-dependent receptor [Novosphingobium sp.]